MDVVVLATEGAPRFLADRTRRALARHGLDATVLQERDLGPSLQQARGSAWIVRAGARPVVPPRFPPPSATGRTLLAFGATFLHGEVVPDWASFLAAGSFASAPALPRLDSVFVDEPHRLGHRLLGGSLEAACQKLARDAGTRAVRFAALDVEHEEALRVIEVVTTLHRGGAERVVLDLVERLRTEGAHVTLAVLDRASRSVLAPPDGTVDLAATGETRAARIARLAELAAEDAADVVHVHLASVGEIRALARATDVPVVLTLHNDEPGWAPETSSLGEADVAMVLACSTRVAESFARANPPLASRTRIAWNGIGDQPAGRAEEARRAIRTELGLADDAVLLLAIANHRPQKRLELLPGIVAALTSRQVDAHVVVVGEAVSRDAAATAVASEVETSAAELGVASRVRMVGTREDPAPFLAAADVVVTTSAFEGLSLVQLEAVRAGKPLVTTDVSGTEEIAAAHAGVWRVPVDASAEAFAEAVTKATSRGAPRPARLAPAFGSAAMAARHATLLARAAGARRSGGGRGGLVLVANNLATGGAQSSAQRLLLGLHARGMRGAAVVIQEQASYPTRGRELLLAAGVPVLAAPRAGSVDPLVTAEAVARFVDAFDPAAVVFWNVIAQHKVLVAELLAGVPVWDVSPGEMCFSSLAKYFEAPRAGHPVRAARTYGRLLRGAIVKYEAERTRAADVLGVPVHVVPNGVPIAEPASRRIQGRERIVIGTLARVSPDKKLEQLVRAVAHAVAIEPSLRTRLDVRIAGPVELGAEDHAAMLEDLAKGLPVTFVGEQHAPTFLRELDLFAMISEPSGCPNASLEAMAEGIAVVATDVGGARDQIVPDVTGLVVPRGDERALGEALVALASDEPRRAAMGAAGRARAEERFSVTRMVDDYARVLGLTTSPGRAAT